MIAVHLKPAVQRPLTVMVTLDADGTAETVTDAQDSAEHAEALRRLRAWADRGEVDALLAELDEGGDQR